MKKNALHSSMNSAQIIDKAPFNPLLIFLFCVFIYFQNMEPVRAMNLPVLIGCIVYHLDGCVMMKATALMDLMNEDAVRWYEPLLVLFLYF